MNSLPRFRFVSFAHSALPLALLCAMASLPAAAVTIETTATAQPAVTTQLTKAEKQQIKADQKAEKKAEKKAEPPANPPAGPPEGAGGNGNPVRDALTGPGAIPAGFVNRPEGGEGGEQDEQLLSLAAVPGTVPEPGSLALLGAGLLGLSLATRRRSRRLPEYV